jgi:hypothetical protein
MFSNINFPLEDFVYDEENTFQSYLQYFPTVYTSLRHNQ